MKWMKLHIGGQEWTIHKVGSRSKFLRENGKTVYGCCVYDKCRIYLCKDLDAQSLQDTLLHELLHATMYVSGAEAIMQTHMSQDETDELGEQIVCVVTPILHRILKDMGFAFPS